MTTIPLTNNSFLSTSNISFPSTSSTEEKLILLVTGISVPLLVVALAVVIITILAIIGINKRKSTNQNQDTEQQVEDGSYAILMRQKQPNVTSNHPTDVVYAVVDKSKTIACILCDKTKKEVQVQQDKQNVKNRPNSAEKEKQVALEDMYAVVNKQQKKKCKEDTLPTHYNTVEGVYYNTVKKEVEVTPQMPTLHTELKSSVQQY